MIVSGDPCQARMPSREIPGHTHTCSGKHGVDELHMCSDSECRRYFNPPNIAMRFKDA